MSDQVIAGIARRLAEALAASAYERSPETRIEASRRASELVAAVRDEVMVDAAQEQSS